MAQPQQKTYERVPDALPAGGMNLADTPEEIAAQRGLVWDVLKAMASKVSTLQLTTISLPVRLFEPRSYLERIADGWCFASPFLVKAAEAKDSVERLKWVITFAISGLHNTCLPKKKPFNPILGETFEARYADGTSICCEQTSHHPPVTSWQVHGPNNAYQFYGFGEWGAHFSVNSVTGLQKGTHYVSFPDGNIITYELPSTILRGILWGDRIMEYVGTMTFRDNKNGLVATVAIPPPSNAGWVSSWWSGSATPPTDYLRGDIARVKEGGEKGEVISQVAGTWLGCVEFDGKPYWSVSMKELKALKPLPVDQPLPSDARYRVDLVTLKTGDLAQAQVKKTELEELQRRDRKLRAAAQANRDTEEP